MNIDGALELLKRDLEDVNSDLHKVVIDKMDTSEDSFFSMMKDNIKKASKSGFYGEGDNVYAAYTFVAGRQVQFKFQAYDNEIKEALGNDAFFLNMYRGGIRLGELGTQILINRALPFYYLEFGTFSRGISQESAVKKWSEFGVSLD